jgi:hypothetical protein
VAIRRLENAFQKKRMVLKMKSRTRVKLCPISSFSRLTWFCC